MSSWDAQMHSLLKKEGHWEAMVIIGTALLSPEVYKTVIVKDFMGWSQHHFDRFVVSVSWVVAVFIVKSTWYQNIQW